MECPVCREQLAQFWKGDVAVSLCPNCKGAWIEKGELAKVLAVLGGERSRSGHPEENRHDRDGRHEDRQYRRHDGHDSDDDDHGDHYGGRPGENGGKRRRGGVLGNIMDMFG